MSSGSTGVLALTTIRGCVSNVGAYDGGGDARGSSGLVTERMRRCDDASAALRSAADIIPVPAPAPLDAVSALLCDCVCDSWLGA